MEADAHRRTILNVDRSVTGYRWVDRLPEGAERFATAITQRSATSDLVARLLAARGISADEATAYLNPSLRDLLPNPSELTDMDRAAQVLADAVIEGENIAIFGDYDVDGATSSSLLSRYLTALGIDAPIHIPDRLTEGYGPNIPAIEALRDQGAKLLVTVDCGATSFEPLEAAQDMGLKVVVIDHHQMTDALPVASALVNPNRPDDISGQGHLAAVGVVFLVLVALNRALRERGYFTERSEPDLMSLLDLVALGTVCDVVPLQGLNRAYVRRGLTVMAKQTNLGIAALSKSARLNGPAEPFHLGYLLGPRINAGGRIGNASLGARLLTLSDPIEAERIAAKLEDLNRERQALEQVLLEAAEASVLTQLQQGRALLMVAGGDYHPGLVGLIAGRLKERHRRPAFAVALNPDGTGTGSGRSIPGVDLGSIVRRAVENGVLLKGGGHAMAAGLTLDANRFEETQAWLEAAVSEAAQDITATTDLEVDGVLTARGASPALLAESARVGPFGAGNPEPLFVFPMHRLDRPAPVGTSHIRATLVSNDGSKIKAIAFRAQGQPLGEALLSASHPVHIAASLSIDRWGGRETVQAQIKDVAMPT